MKSIKCTWQHQSTTLVKGPLKNRNPKSIHIEVRQKHPASYFSPSSKNISKTINHLQHAETKKSFYRPQVTRPKHSTNISSNNETNSPPPPPKKKQQQQQQQQQKHSTKILQLPTFPTFYATPTSGPAFSR